MPAVSFVGQDSLTRHPADRDTLLALVTFNRDAGDVGAALDYAERLRFSIYDAMVVAAAVNARCSTLWTEDLQHRQKIQHLTIRNPFLG